MPTLLRPAAGVLAATAWIGLNEFVRNQVVLAQHWTDHYARMGLTFPATPANGAVWGLWSLLFATALHFITRDRSLSATIAIGWLVGFVLMWVVIGNLGVLPFGILWVALPWSIAECAGAAWIVRKLR